MCYFYPRSPCGERRDVIAVMTDAQSISIHALLAESDLQRNASCNCHSDFYPRSPCGERLEVCILTHHVLLFLSTLSLRRATDKRSQFNGDNGFLSTLSLRRATAAFCQAVPPKLYFYPRSPCGERRIWISSDGFGCLFLSTLSLRRATRRLGAIHDTQINISIHALLAESDARRALGFVDPDISIHALLAESDCYSLRHSAQGRHFYPRSPCGERLGVYPLS